MNKNTDYFFVKLLEAYETSYFKDTYFNVCMKKNKVVICKNKFTK